ncbi:MAG: hypothetical protein RI965_1485 [Bacteroidota bacterium]|jgi:hypothetical protein
MKEVDIQLFWLNNATQFEQLYTSYGESIKVIHPGMINLNQGPDFFHATIQIDDTIWVGSVEIHVKASGWFLHRHDIDRNYNNVILHVVWEDDTVSFDHCPILVLSSFLKVEIFNHKININTAENITEIQNALSMDDLSEFGLQRIERKSNEILVDLKLFQGNWQFITVRKLIYAFGIPLNGDVFQQIIDTIFPIFNTQHYFNEENIKCLLFGQASLFVKMSKLDILRFNDLRTELSIKSPHINIIRFRTRPSNFPEKRLEDFIAFIFKYPSIFRPLIDSEIDYSGVIKNIRTELGGAQFNKIVINVFVPILIAYSKYNGNVLLRKKAMHWLTLVPAESNRITKLFVQGRKIHANALHTQGMMEYYSSLKNPKPN